MVGVFVGMVGRRVAPSGIGGIGTGLPVGIMVCAFANLALNIHKIVRTFMDTPDGKN
jgi:hypothetical protein